MTTFNLPRMDQYSSAAQPAGFGALRSRHGNLPLAALAYHTRIRSLAFSTTITQTFYNPFDECIEANYIFPIEGDQAVVRCDMIVGDRVIRADLRERGEARAAYQRAIRAGHRASLLEENRSETFALAVGNIPPGEAVQVRLTTVGQLPVDHGRWTLRLPLVVAPRYVSGFPLPGRSAGSGVAADTDAVPDASTVTPTTLLPNFPNPVDLRLDVEIDTSAFPGGNESIASLESSLHAIGVRTDEHDGRCRISIHPGERVDRDFILRGRLDSTQIASSLLFEPPSQKSRPDCEGTFAIHVVPPQCTTTSPRDVSFVLDRSGSMGGWKMEAAVRGMSRLIDSLRQGDRFQVIAFDDRCESPFGKRKHAMTPWIDASDQNRWKAVQWLGKISARGGTEMAAAIQNGLAPFLSASRTAIGGEAAPARSSAMVLVTDGQIAGEDSVLRTIESCPVASRPRLFCLGIDRAVNASVLRRLADHTGGTFELVESEKRLDEVLRSFADEIGSPAVTDLRVEPLGWACDTLCLAPQRRTDLYHGRAVSIYGRAPLRDHPLRLVLRGRLPDGSAWSKELTATLVDGDGMEGTDREQPMLLPLWGRKRVRELEDRFAAQGCIDEGLRESIVHCSLESQVLCRFTAYVAVDETEVVSNRRSPHRITQPVHLPEGWLRHLPSIDKTLLIQVAKPAAEATRHPMGSDPIRGTLDKLPALREYLLRHVVSEEQLAEAEQLAPQSGSSICDTLFRLQYAGEEQLAKAVAHATGVPHVDLRQERIDDRVIEMIPESVARENGVLPLWDDRQTLTVVMSDPTDLETIEKLRFILNRPIKVAVDAKSQIQLAINQYYGRIEGESADSMLQEFTDTAIEFCETESGETMSFIERGYSSKRSAPPNHDVLSFVESDFDDSRFDDLSFDSGCFAAAEVPPPSPCSMPRSENPISRALSRLSRRRESNPPALDSAPVVRLVNLILQEAVQLGATHILIQPDSAGIGVGFVIDGKWVRRETVPLRMLAGIITRLRILAKIDIATRAQRVDGRLKLTIGDRPVDAAVHFAPTSCGDSVLIELVECEGVCDEILAWREQVQSATIEAAKR